MEPRKKRTLNTRSQSRGVIWVVLQTQGAKRHSHGIITRARALQMPRRRRMEGANLHRHRLRSRTAWRESWASCKPHRTKNEWVGRASPSVRRMRITPRAAVLGYPQKLKFLRRSVTGTSMNNLGRGYVGWNPPQVQRGGCLGGEAPSLTPSLRCFLIFGGVRRSPGNSPMFWI